MAFSVAFAQPKDNSPYSNLGLGNFMSQDFAAQGGMGSLSAAFHDPTRMNFQNPASFGYLGAASFDVGGFAKYTSLSADGQSENVLSGNIGYFAIGFALRNPLNEVFEGKRSKFRWGMGFGLMPYTQRGYEVQTETAVPGFDTVRTNIQGRGDLNQVLWSNGFKYGNISGGFTLGYMFGKLTRDRRDFFPELGTSFFNDLLQETSYEGVVYRGGIQYEYTFGGPVDAKDKRARTRLTIGASGTLNNTISSNSRFVDVRLSSISGALDTVNISEDDIENDVQLPAEYDFGFVLAKDNKWKVGANFKGATWGSDYINPTDDPSEEFANSYTASIGGEYVPNYRSYNNYWQRVVYRAGAFYGKDPRVVGGEQLTRYGVNVGFGLPLRNEKTSLGSYMDVAIEAGYLGVAEGIEENYVKLTLGFNFSNTLWFYKRRYE